MYFIGIVSNSMSRKIIHSTLNQKNLFGHKMKSSLNHLFIRLTDVILRNKYLELQLLLKLENGDVRLLSQGVENCKTKRHLRLIGNQVYE